MNSRSIITATAVVLCLGLVVPGHAQDGTVEGPDPAAQDVNAMALSPENISFGRARDLARESGFADLEIDMMHGRLGRQAAATLTIPGVPEEPGEFYELLATSDARLILKGEDSHGKPYVRVTLREGNTFSTDIFPKRYVFRAHAYLFPSDDGTELSKIIFQFYRINFGGSSYKRELRRLIHPNPKNLAQAEGKDLTAELQLLNNSEITLEYFEEPSEVRPVWEGPDGVPVPEITQIQPKERVQLVNPETPLEYDEQIRLMVRYKRLLRTVSQLLEARIESHRLDREMIIEQLLDFPT